jgi:hypothetical protein
MGLADIDFDSIEITEGYENSLLPDGDYIVSLERAVDEADIVSSEGAKYSRLALMFRIVEGEYSNKCVFRNCMMLVVVRGMVQKDCLPLVR